MRLQPLFPGLLAFSGLLATATPSLNAQDVEAEARERSLQAQITALSNEIQAARTGLVKSIEVNGVELDPRQVLREAVFLMGGKLVEAKVMEFFVEEEIEAAIRDGRDPKEFEITDEEILVTLESMQNQFAQTYPEVSFWEVLRVQTGLDRSTFLHQQRQGMLFERAFFPGLPDDWPLITREAIIASTGGQGGQDYLDQLQQSMTDPQGNMQNLPAFWQQMMRTWIDKQLREWSDIRYPSDGLPDDQVLSVNDRTWDVEEAYEYVRPGLYAQDIERSLAEVVIREVLRQELSTRGYYIGSEEFRKRWDVYREPFDSTPFSTTVIAVTFKGFPSLEAFRQRWRLISSFKDMIADDITDENLKAHGEKFRAFFSDGRISFDLIPFVGKDPTTLAWLPDGMKEAGERAEAAFDKLAKGEITFEDLQEEYGEFSPTSEDRGVLGYKPLNQVRQILRETEFTDLLRGYAVANALFYDAEVGKTVGPLRGPDAYYIARVNLRTPPYRTVNVDDSQQRELLEQDYVNWRFLQWANDLLGKAVIK